MDWSKVPDLIAVGLLVWAFTSVARRSHTRSSGHWLFGWLLILLHFVAFMFRNLPGAWGSGAVLLGLLSLVWAGLLFTRSAVPYREEVSSRLMLGVLVATYTAYTTALTLTAPAWLLQLLAVALAVGPLAVTLVSLAKFTHVLRWLIVGLQCVLALVLLLVQNRPGGDDLALNAVMFIIYLGTALHFWYLFRRGSTGALITVAGFFLWAGVFIISPAMHAGLANVHIEEEVWNLPKYIVAVGMILLLLEEQISHNKHLALHDDLTGLPNRRLFQDRLHNTLQRAHRAQVQAALLMLDLDHFKQVNDSLGHHAGDIVLQRVSALLTGRVRRSDTVARTGGDEFAVILEAPTTYKEATQVAQQLVALLNEPMTLKDRQVHIGASLGIAVYPVDAEDAESLCITADLRMYDNKRSREGSDDDGTLDPPRRGPAQEEPGQGGFSMVI